MEHRLILGGDEYLPFARSCITKLKKLGVPYADQAFETGGASIKVRIEPGHEYIRIEGGADTLSGVVKGRSVGVYVPDEGPIKELREFKPTLDCLTKVLKKAPPASFAYEKKLETKADACLRPRTPDHLQTNTVCPSMYSGLMQSVVQFLLGKLVGKTTAPLKYNYQWDETHIVSKGDLGGYYLVEISQARGVLAMQLPFEDAKNCVAVNKMRAMFKGVPNGRVIPKDAALEDAVSSGRVARLMTPETLAPFYNGSRPLSHDHGWTTNTTGSEAHNVMLTSGPGIEEHAAHYKIPLVLIEKKPDSPPDAPCVTCDTSLVRVSEGRLYWGGGSALGGASIPTYKLMLRAYSHKEAVDNPGRSGYVGIAAEYIEEHTPQDASIACDTTVFVYFQGDDLKVVNYKWSNAPLVDSGPDDHMVTGAWVDEYEQRNGMYYPTGRTIWDPTIRYFPAGTYSGTGWTLGGTVNVCTPSLAEGGGAATTQFVSSGSRYEYEFTKSSVPFWHYTVTYTSHSLYDITRDGPTEQIAIFPQGMRNGWLDCVYSFGQRTISERTSIGAVEADNLPEFGVWVLVSGTGLPDSVNTYVATEELGTSKDIIYPANPKLVCTWHPTGETNTLSGLSTLDVFSTILARDVSTMRLFGVDGIAMMSDGTQPVMIWSVDSTDTNSVRSIKIESTATHGPVVARGPLVSEESESKDLAKLYSFIGYTGA